jgi:hypothetical protein
MLLTFIFFLLRAQNRSFWRRIINVGLRGILSFLFLKDLFSGAYTFLFFLVFVRGLLVLLVRVSCLRVQDQRTALSKKWIFLVILILGPFLVQLKTRTTSESLFPISIWVINQPQIVSGLGLTLILGLVVTSKLVLRFKRLVRAL